MHLPGHDQHEPWRAFQHLEKRYFEVGPDGFQVWRAFGGVVGMAICNDRRWPEAYRVLGLQGAELVLIGYNTPVHNPPAPEHDRLGDFHNHLVMQSGAYQNGTWVVGVAKAGDEEGVPMIGGSAIIAPSGEIAALCTTLGDEVAVARCDLSLCDSYKTTVFDFAAPPPTRALHAASPRNEAPSLPRWISLMDLDAFVADSVVAVDGKLYAQGAGWNVITTPQLPVRHARIGLGLIIHVPYTATNTMHRFDVRLDDSDGGRVAIGDAPPGAPSDDGKLYGVSGQFTVGRPALLPAGDEQIVVVALNLDGVVFQKADAYNFVVEIDSEERKRLPIRVTRSG